MAKKIIAWDDVNNRPVRTNLDPATVGSTGPQGATGSQGVTGLGSGSPGTSPAGGSGGAIPDYVVARSLTLSSGATSVSYTYDTAFTNLDYSIQVNFTNTVDSAPLFQPAIVVTKTISGFTASWPLALDSNNYKLDFHAVVPYLLYQSNVESIPAAASSYSTAAAYSAALPFTGGFTNLTDAANTLVYQTDVITNSAGQFAPTWNTPLNTANYLLEWNTISVTSPERKSGTTGLLTVATTSITVNFIFPTLYSSVYSVIPRFENTVDGSVVYQPITVTAKSLTSFTAKWNAPLDTGNYKIKWIVDRIV